jgi:tetratricopeptide (TPR) repeat protein
MKCPICNAENPPGASSCRQCGFGLGLRGPSPSEALAPQRPVPAVGPREPPETEAPDARAGQEVQTRPPASQIERMDGGDRPDGAQRHLERAYDHEENGELVEALQECEAAVGAAPDLAEAHNLRGILLEELGRHGEAAEAYRTAVRLEPGFSEARDNLRELKAELTRGQDVVTVTTFVNALEAQAAQAKLAERGIWSHVVDEFMLIVPPGGVRLMAGESDLEEIIEALGLEADEDEGWQCPKCGSWEVRVPLLGRKRECESCGHQWKVG